MINMDDRDKVIFRAMQDVNWHMLFPDSLEFVSYVDHTKGQVNIAVRFHEEWRQWAIKIEARNEE